MKKNVKRSNKSIKITPRQRQMIFRKAFTIVSVFIIGFVLAMIISGLNSRVKASDNYYKYYKSIEVHPGDTLYDYSIEYGDHFESREKFIKEVCSINYINADDIKSGMNLIIPYYSTEYIY